MAAFFNAKESALLLCQLGAVVNEKDESLNTALHLAAIEEYEELAEILV